MLLVTWNVNSLNARLPRVQEFLQVHAPDVLCLQETKCSQENFPHLELQAAGYVGVDHGSGGRNGVALLVRDDLTPEDVQIGLPGEPHPHEARWVEATVAGVRVVSTYVINGRALDDPVFERKLEMLDAIRDRAAALSGDPLAILGDFNIAPRDEDVWDMREFASPNATHVTDAERDRLASIRATGLADGWDVTPERGEHQFTWWDYRAGNFHKNKGLRIDLGLVSPDLQSRLEHVGIDRDFRKGTKPSDHAPLLLRLAD